MATIPASHADLLTAKTAFANVATLNPDGSPQVTPVWVDFDGTHVLVNTAKGRVKAKNLAREPRVALSIADPENPYRYLGIQGRVVEMTEDRRRRAHRQDGEEVSRQGQLSRPHAGRSASHREDLDRTRSTRTAERSFRGPSHLRRSGHSQRSRAAPISARLIADAVARAGRAVAGGRRLRRRPEGRVEGGRRDRAARRGRAVADGDGVGGATGKDARVVEVILRESRRIVRHGARHAHQRDAPRLRLRERRRRRFERVAWLRHRAARRSRRVRRAAARRRSAPHSAVRSRSSSRTRSDGLARRRRQRRARRRRTAAAPRLPRPRRHLRPSADLDGRSPWPTNWPPPRRSSREKPPARRSLSCAAPPNGSATATAACWFATRAATCSAEERIRASGASSLVTAGDLRADSCAASRLPRSERRCTTRITRCSSSLMIPNALFYFAWDTLVLSVVIRWFHGAVPYARAAAGPRGVLCRRILQHEPGTRRDGRVPEPAIARALSRAGQHGAVPGAHRVHAARGVGDAGAARVSRGGVEEPGRGGRRCRHVLAVRPLADRRRGHGRSRAPSVSPRASRYVQVVLLRAPMFFVSLCLHYYAAHAFGIHIPFAQMLTFLPVSSCSPRCR